MEREDMIQIAGSSVLRPIGLIQVAFWLMLIAVPFTWIWEYDHLTLKLLWTSLIGIFVSGMIHMFMKKIIGKEVDKIIEQEKGLSEKRTTKFSERLEEYKRSNRK